jgi:hypothetical protein
MDKNFDNSIVNQLEFHSKKDSLFAMYNFVLDGYMLELNR